MRRQDVIRRVIWSVPDVSSVFGTSGMYKDQSDLGDILLAVFDHLDMPPSLKDVAVGEDKLEVLVDRSILDIFVMNNPIPLEEGKVIEILQMVLSH
jgi:alcohol dehydrogenase class IV